MSENLEYKYIESILVSDEEKNLLKWLSQELQFDEILKKIKSTKVKNKKSKKATSK